MTCAAPGTAPPPRRRVDGVLLLDKDVGLSSNAALQQVKRLFRAEKAGHTGTLDPLASGLLPICFGEATKFAHMLLEADKTYVATVRLGVTTTTGDAEGEVLKRQDVSVTRDEVEAVLPRFVGRIAQIPPRHAALKYQGRNYYEYAREGVEIPRAAREVTIESLTLQAWTHPDFDLMIRCGKGTYVRVLAEDIGVGARLRRASGGAAPAGDRRPDAGSELHARGPGGAQRGRARRPPAALRHAGRRVAADRSRRRRSNAPRTRAGHCARGAP